MIGLGRTSLPSSFFPSLFSLPCSSAHSKEASSRFFFSGGETAPKEGHRSQEIFIYSPPFPLPPSLSFVLRRRSLNRESIAWNPWNSSRRSGTPHRDGDF